jgi:hypothetical protein
MTISKKNKTWDESFLVLSILFCHTSITNTKRVEKRGLYCKTDSIFFFFRKMKQTFHIYCFVSNISRFFAGYIINSPTFGMYNVWVFLINYLKIRLAQNRRNVNLLSINLEKHKDWESLESLYLWKFMLTPDRWGAPSNHIFDTSQEIYKI